MSENKDFPDYRIKIGLSKNGHPISAEEQIVLMEALVNELPT